MFLGSLEKSLREIIFSPQVLFPMLVVVILSAVSDVLTGFVLSRPMEELLLYSESFLGGDFFFMFVTRFWLEVLVMVVSGFVIFVASIVAFIALAEFASGKKVADAIDLAMKQIGKSISLVFFAIILAFLFFVFVVVIDTIFAYIYPLFSDSINSVIALFPIIIILIAFILLMTKLAFVLPAILDKKLKEAIKQSWDFTNNKFWKTFFYIVVVSIISVVIISIFSNLGLLFDLEFILNPIGDIVTLTFFGLAISNFYFNNK
jgi:hypothetical protein